MSKRKLFEDVDELFVKTKGTSVTKNVKNTWTSVTKIVGIEIPAFLEKIEKGEQVESPRFKLAGVEFSIVVFSTKRTKFVYVEPSLANRSDEDQTTSVTFTDESGVERSWQMEPLGAKDYDGFPNFLSYEDYKTWAKDHGDVFKVKAKVTLHQKRKTTEDEDGWIRYVFNYILVRLP